MKTADTALTIKAKKFIVQLGWAKSIEEIQPGDEIRKDMIKCVIHGHHSRDEEVRKLVEVLETANELINDPGTHQTREWRAKAKEAIKPYIK